MSDDRVTPLSGDAVAFGSRLEKLVEEFAAARGLQLDFFVGCLISAGISLGRFNGMADRDLDDIYDAAMDVIPASGLPASAEAG